MLYMLPAPAAVAQLRLVTVTRTIFNVSYPYMLAYSCSVILPALPVAVACSMTTHEPIAVA